MIPEIDRYVIELTETSRLFKTEIELDLCPNPKDNPILACAVATNADYLVTRNLKHFPDEHAGTQVIHPRKFLAMLNQ